MKMRSPIASALVLSLGMFLGAPAGAQPTAEPTPSGVPTAAEKPFVDAISADLNKRFPTAADAEKAGYVRYTNEDETGAISYANKQWASKDETTPSQLWYDASGKLLGADYSVLLADSKTAPSKFGVNPERWQKFGAPHYHFALPGKDDALQFGAIEIRPTGKHAGVYAFLDPAPGAKPILKKLTGASATDATNDAKKVSAEAVVDAGLTQDVSKVKFFFEFPALWDLVVWVAPNPKGAFAEMNPNVKPVHPPAKMGGAM